MQVSRVANAADVAWWIVVILGTVGGNLLDSPEGGFRLKAARSKDIHEPNRNAG